MCGIAGFITAEQKLIDQKTLSHINESLFHRGPDGHGLLFFDGTKTHTHQHIEAPFASKVFLLHRRLSILDLSPEGAQPMSSPDGRYHLTFNGEIYNFIELKEDLLKKGYTFKSHSDTEVLLYMLIEYGAACLKDLRGMFAFAFLDTQTQSVIIARDHFGIKPFFYTQKPGSVAFASELIALKPFLPNRPKINPSITYTYLSSGLTDSNNSSLIQDISMLQPGHYARIDLKNPHVEQVPFYELKANTVYTAQDLSQNEAAGRVRDLFLKSVELHMRSDVAVGAALSGGIDSSAVVSAVRHLYPNQEIHTFSYIAEGKLSEEKWVDIVTSHAKTTAHKVFIKPDDILDDFDTLLNHQGEPFGGTSIYAQYRVFKLAKEQGIKVTLDGQGADEFLGGYSRYCSNRLSSLLKKGDFLTALNYTHQALKNNPDLNGKRFIFSALPVFLQNILKRSLQKPSVLNQSWIKSDFYIQRKTSYPEEVLKNNLVGAVKKDLLHLLRYADHNSMASSIESRVPFLMPELIEFVLSLPEDYIIDNNGVRKSIFKQAMVGIMPEAILARKDKVGFETPQKNWVHFLKEKAYNLIGDLEQTNQNLFDMPALKTFFNGPFDEKSAWQIINFLIFTKNYNLDLNHDDKGGL